MFENKEIKVILSQEADEVFQEFIIKQGKILYKKEESDLDFYLFLSKKTLTFLV